MFKGFKGFESPVNKKKFKIQTTRSNQIYKHKLHIYKVYWYAQNLNATKKGRQWTKPHKNKTIIKNSKKLQHDGDGGGGWGLHQLGSPV